MRGVIVIPAFAVLLAGASEPPSSSLDNPAYSDPPERWETIEDALPPADEAGAVLPEGVRLPDIRECRDTIENAREASGQPPLLEREPASPDEPVAIYAVDRRQDGCSVMVVMGNRDDIRPLPQPAEGGARVIPAQRE